ncbi:SWIM zinc finger family protein [Hymenobacter bucti]|uniref:SWIM zinc finger family protein n=1 Tax=Hymenobacter bucti TaxID=1844114 RepID=A0ABW4QZ24_9BACT
MRVYATPDGQASVVVLELGGGQEFLLALSAEVKRGFSGEGNQLDALAEDLLTEWLTGANNLFHSNEAFNPTLFGLTHDLELATVARLCASLAAMGLQGFNLRDNQYFYRRLPFKTLRILQLNPRLKNADDVQLVAVGPGGRTEARVCGTEAWHTVQRGGTEPPRCTCQWFSTNQGQRGVCKHILAAQLRFG